MNSGQPARPSNYRVPPDAHNVVLDQRRKELSHQLTQILGDTVSFLWEVGCGHGHFLTAYAAAHPHQICIGIDIASDRIARANRKRDRAKLPNLHFVRAEARLFLEAIPEGRTIRDVFILFPDPWPKTRHHKHRILQSDFLGQLAGRMGEGGHLFFRTDHRPYFDEAVGMVSADSSWELLGDTQIFEHQTVFQNRAEEFWSLRARLARGQLINARPAEKRESTASL